MADLVAVGADPGRGRRDPEPTPVAGSVTAVLVVCDGMEWLPAALAALSSQERAPDRIVAVDVGSVDGSGLLCVRALGAARLVGLARGTSFAAAVASGLAAVGGPPPDGFVWLLHDDAAPRPDALRHLLLYAATDPSAAVLGPKIHDWSAPGIVREVGVALDRTARRVTGLAPDEHDHGQHDGPRDVPAVSTAGLLVRSGAWTRLGGLSVDLAAAEDVDFGWRAGRSGLRVVVVPMAVVTHRRAGATGRRGIRTPRVARRTHRQAALFVRLANAPAGWLPLIAVHLALVGLGRTAVRLARLRPADAADELLATAAVFASVRLLARGRRTRRAGSRAGRPVPHRVVRRTHALIPAQRAPLGRDPAARDPAARDLPSREAAGREAAGGPAVEVRPVEVRRPDRTWMALGGVLAVVGLATARAGGGFGSTGVAARLLPAPGGATAVWSALASGWSGGASAGLGGPGPAPGWTPALAVLSTLCGGKPWLALDLVLAGGPVLAGLAAWWAAGSIRPAVRRPVRLAGAGAYGLVPVVTGTVAAGRFDVVLAMVVLPLTLAAAVRASGAVPRRVRAAAVARVALGAAAVAACSPPLAIPLALVLLGGAALTRRPARLVHRLAWVFAVFGAAAAMLWTFAADAGRQPGLLVRGYGTLAAAPVTGPLVAAGSRPVALAAAAGAGVVGLAALVGLTRPRVAPAAWAGWAVALIAAGAAAGSARGIAGVRGSIAPDLALAALGLLGAAMVATRGARLDLGNHAFSWRQPAAAALAAVTLGAPVVLAVVAVVAPGSPASASSGAGSAPWGALAGPDGGRVLVLTGSAPVRYSLVGSLGPRLGDLDARVPAAARAFTSATVTALVTGAGDPAVTARLVPLGVGAVAVPASGAGGAVVAALDATPGLVRAQVGTGFLVWRPAAGGPGADGGAGGGARLSVVDGATARPVGADGQVPAGGNGRALVLAEPVDRAWRATLDGRRLPARPGSGFGPAFALPAAGGRVLVRYDDGPRRIVLGAQAVAVLLAVGVASNGAQRIRRRTG